jgi:hypothetical protein
MNTPLRSWSLWLGAALVVGTLLGASARPQRTSDPLTLSTSDYFKVRLAAARLLGRHDDRASTLRLHAMLTDQHPLVRSVARATLDRRDLAASLCAPVAFADPR